MTCRRHAHTFRVPSKLDGAISSTWLTTIGSTEMTTTSRG